MTARPRTVLAMDVGGTKTALGLVTGSGEVLARHTFASRGGDDDVAVIARTTRAWLLAEAAGASTAAPIAVCAGFPEYVDHGGELTSREVLSWTRQPSTVLREALSDLAAPGAPVIVDSDVRLGALGEAVAGAGVGASSFLYVSLGTGLSATLVLGGTPWPGQRGEAIGLGEWPVPGEPSGSRTTLEAYCSGAGIAERYYDSTGRREHTRDLARLALEGDDTAREIQVEAGRALGTSIAALVAVLDPQLVVLGGGLGTSEAPVVTATRQRYQERVGGRPHAPRLRSALVGPDAGLIGAGARGWHGLQPTR